MDGLPVGSMEERRALDADRFSVLMAVILLGYALTPFIDIPITGFVLQLPGAGFSFEVDFATIVSLIVAGLAASGMLWLLQGHPSIKGGAGFQHIILPATTAWAIGVTLNMLKAGPQWWVVLGLGSLLLGMVFWAEYVVVDLRDARHVPASIGLIAVSYALFLMLIIAVRAAEMRLYLEIPVGFLSAFVVCLRTLYLRLSGRWMFGWSFAIAMIAAQVALGLHYTPLLPIPFGIVLLGLVYALVNLASGIEEERPWRTLWIEPLVMLVLLSILTLVIVSGR